MEFADVKDWLDALIEDLKNRKAHIIFNNQIRTVSPMEKIQIYEGINVVADMIGAELGCLSEYSDEYPYYYWFYYRGVKFFEIESVPLEV